MTVFTVRRRQGQGDKDEDETVEDDARREEEPTFAGGVRVRRPGLRRRSRPARRSTWRLLMLWTRTRRHHRGWSPSPSLARGSHRRVILRSSSRAGWSGASRALTEVLQILTSRGPCSHLLVVVERQRHAELRRICFSARSRPRRARRALPHRARFAFVAARLPRRRRRARCCCFDHGESGGQERLTRRSWLAARNNDAGPCRCSISGKKTLACA